jgi:pyridinium-3,5-biscarboxylic acid mononucleotide sulfurtransferase
MSARAKLEHLQAILKGYERALVCFSGGVDSTFLLRVASEVLGRNCFAVTCVSETMAASEIADARALAAEMGLGERHVTIESHELDRPGFADNPVDRCAMCKSELMEHAAPLARQLGARAIALGTNLDDLGDYRPGVQAAAERGAEAPMCDAGLTKAEIRELSRELGLRTWNKPQLACLSSRFPYGTRITSERLRQVDRFEDGLRNLGFGQLRVRFHEQVARVELERTEMSRALELGTEIVALGKRCGFPFVALDLAGFRSGSLNAGLVPLRKRAS